MKKKINYMFIICVFSPLLLGFIVSLIVGFDSYMIINKPILSPPSIVFPIVWSIIYLLMGISLYMVLKKNNNHDSITKFIEQLLINLIWSFFFFNFKQYVFSAVLIVLIIYLVIIMIIDFIRIKKIAGYLQFPYLVWLLFALYLNIGVAILN